MLCCIALQKLKKHLFISLKSAIMVKDYSKEVI